MSGLQYQGGFKLGLCCSRPESFQESPGESSLENALDFLNGSAASSWAEPASVARLDAGAGDLERSLSEAVENDVTHVFFISHRTLLPFYAMERLRAVEGMAVSGISWTWMLGPPGGLPEVFPRLGYFDPEGRPYPYFGWTAPDIFEVDWCGLDCLLLSREALEEIGEILPRVRGREPALRISQCLRSMRIPILVDSSVQCPRAVAPWASQLVPTESTWEQFARNFPGRRVPPGLVFDPAYRGRAWYREWLDGVALK